MTKTPASRRGFCMSIDIVSHMAYMRDVLRLFMEMLDLTPSRSPRIFTALRALRGNPFQDDKSSIQGNPPTTWGYASRASRRFRVPWDNGDQPIRAGYEPAGSAPPSGAPDGSVRLGIPAKELASLTQARLQELLHYDPDTGIFTWRVDRLRVRPGDRAGKLRSDGYIVIGVDGKRHPAHRLAFLYMTGAVPAGYIDHINLTKSDNRWCNLRPASNGQNQMNTKMRPNNTSGFKGVSWITREKRWRADIRANGKKMHLGYFDKPDAAYAAYCAAAIKLHGEYARLD